MGDLFHARPVDSGWAGCIVDNDDVLQAELVELLKRHIPFFLGPHPASSP
jgi:hypothetical protein